MNTSYSLILEIVSGCTQPWSTCSSYATVIGVGTAGAPGACAPPHPLPPLPNQKVFPTPMTVKHVDRLCCSHTKKKKTDNHRTQVACVLYIGIMDANFCKPTRAAVSSLFPPLWMSKKWGNKHTKGKGEFVKKCTVYHTVLKTSLLTINVHCLE